MEEQTKFIDAEGYQGDFQQGISFKDIVMQHVKKIVTLSCCEWRGGFWEIKPSPNPQSNQEYKIYIEDTRELFSNAVETLADLLAPYFDEDMKNAEEQAIEEDRQAFENKTIIKQPDREDENPEEAKEYERSFAVVEDRISYRTQRLRINRKLFRALCQFLYREKYLEVGIIQD